MSSVLAIISKKLFEGDHRTATIGEVLPISTYSSHHRVLETLGDGGSLFLVTIRPPDHRLWLVAEIRSIKKAKTGWSGDVNSHSIVDITSLIGELKFEKGKGITVPRNRLAMSLQTPRALTDADVAHLSKATSATKAKVSAKPSQRPSKPDSKGAAEVKGTATRRKESAATKPKLKPVRVEAKAVLEARASLEQILASRMNQAIPELQNLTSEATQATINAMFELDWFDIDKWRSSEAMLFWVYSYFVAIRFGTLEHARALRSIPKRAVYSQAHEQIKKMRLDVATIIERRLGEAHKGPPAAKLPKAKAKLAAYIFDRIGDPSWEQVDELVAIIHKPRFSLESFEGLFIFAALILHGSPLALAPLRAFAQSPLLSQTLAVHSGQKKRGAEGEKLLELVYADPTETDSIGIYADWLLEQNDERGAFIQAQLSGQNMPIKDLTLVKWAGKLSRVLRWRAPFANERPCHQLRFRRGFLSGCRIEEFSEEVVDTAEWATVEVLDIEKSIKSLEGFDLRSLRALGGLSPVGVTTIAETRLLDQLVAIGVSSVDESVLDALNKFPKLRWLMVSKIPEELTAHPLFDRLQAIVVDKREPVSKPLRERVEVISTDWLFAGLCLPQYNLIAEQLFAESQPTPRPLEPLLAAIYENPRDLASREAYGAHLTAQRDVRGEFIALQCERSRNGGKRTKREAALDKAHRREWLGRLDEVALATELKFENGFVSALHFANKNRANVIGLDEWRTLRALVLTQHSSGFAEMIADPVLANLERLECPAFHLGEILAKKRRHRWTSLKVWSRNLSNFVGTIQSATLPNLAALELDKTNVGASELLELLDSPLGRRLKRLRCKVWKEVSSIETTAEGTIETLELEVFADREDKRPNWLLTFSCPPKGKQYTQLEVRHLTGKPPQTTHLLTTTLATVSGKSIATTNLVGTKSVRENKTVREHVNKALARLPGSPVLTT